MDKAKILKLIDIELEKGNFSQTEFAGKLNMSPVVFSQWKSGTRLPPDPRNEENLAFYKNLAGHLKISLNEAILFSLPLEEKTSTITSAFIKGFESRAAEKMLKNKYADSLERIALNLVGCEYFLEIFEKMLRQYISLTKKNWKWIENKNQAKEEYKKRNM